jgi:YgiT-type zinc finger domain-containing protein
MTGCAMCHGKEFVQVQVDREVSVGKRRFIASVPADQCQQCQELYFSLPLLTSLTRTIAQELLEMGAVDGESFQFVRKAAHLPAKDLAELIDVTPATVSRWEHGKQPIDRGTWIVLGDLLNDFITGSTGTRHRLEAAARPRKPGAVMRIEVAA